MANQVTYESLQEASDAKYAHYQIVLPDGELVTLLNALRLSEEARDKLKALQNRDEDDDTSSQVEDLRETIRIVSATPGPAEKLLTLIGDDLAMLGTVVAGYSKGTSVGEA